MAKIPKEQTACWCGWPDGQPGRTHDEYIEVYEYPFHLPSPEWNLPEPLEE